MELKYSIMTHFYSILLCSSFSVENQIRHGNVSARPGFEKLSSSLNLEVNTQPAASSAIPEVTSKKVTLSYPYIIKF